MQLTIEHGMHSIRVFNKRSRVNINIEHAQNYIIIWIGHVGLQACMQAMENQNNYYMNGCINIMYYYIVSVKLYREFLNHKGFGYLAARALQFIT